MMTLTVNLLEPRRKKMKPMSESEPCRGYIAEYPNDEEELEGIDLQQKRYPGEGSDRDYLYDEVSISLDGFLSIFESWFDCKSRSV
ncbi:hypothetical protein Bca101_082972 [Brassica carinata]